MIKKCTKCKQDKDISMFHRDCHKKVHDNYIILTDDQKNNRVILTKEDFNHTDGGCGVND